MTDKLRQFVASLSDDEIESQLDEIFEWAKVYKELLEEELDRRQSSEDYGCFSFVPSETKDDEFEPVFDSTSESTAVDYELAEKSRQAVSCYSEQETRVQLDRLKQISSQNLSPKEAALLQYQIELCELRIFELTGKAADNLCPACGQELEIGARFCGKCGAAIK